MICPFCAQENLDGADVCEHCAEPLDFLSQPRPTSAVERCLLHDQVGTLINRRAITVPPDMAVGQVLQIMVERKIGCVIVAEGNLVQGIFSDRDALLRLDPEAASFDRRPIRELMTPSPVTLEHDAEIAFALQKMDIGGYRHLPITRHERVVGVISIRDILRYIADHVSPVA